MNHIENLEKTYELLLREEMRCHKRYLETENCLTKATNMRLKNEIIEQQHTIFKIIKFLEEMRND